MGALCGVLGWPVRHSRSPQMHEAGYAALGLAGWRYQLLPVPPELFEETVRALPGAGFTGANVTIPHKEAALTLADEATAAARAIGAANTLTFLPDGRIHADNTDAPGLIDALPLDVAGATAVVLGAGGTARAATWALLDAGAADVAIWNRTPERAQRLVAELGGRVLDHGTPVLGAADLLVNTTSVGLDGSQDQFKHLPLTVDEVSHYRCVVDLVYGARPTGLVTAARNAGIATVDGLELLVRQGPGASSGGPGRPLPWTPSAPALAAPDGRLHVVAGESAPAAAAARDTPGWDGVTPPSRRGGSGRFLTDVLVDLGFVARDRVEQAVAQARADGRPPERVLLEQGAVGEDQLARAIGERYGLDHLDLTVYAIDMAAANMLSSAAAKRYDAVPVAFTGERGLIVAMADPANVLAVDDIAMLTRLEVRPAVASREDVAALIARLDRFGDSVREAVDEEAAGAEADGEVVELRDSADDAPVVKLVNSIIAQAAERGASDIHFEPDGRELRVRFRVDGVLSTTTAIPHRMVAGVISRTKIMADLDIAERRLPQDGRVGLTVEERHVDVRVVTLPSVHGETVVMRLLDKQQLKLQLDRLGMQAPERTRFERAFGQAYGALLVTGPTGSGKSTTLYAALSQLNTPEKNIITIEDPVEYQLEGVTQVQVNPKAGLTFSNGLRSMMRADPDVIMVGEIRDRDTAQIAVEAALTGHLVLSTLHTNDAPTAITRLIEMGIEPFLVASAIDCVVAQRLARSLCPTCKKRVIVPAQVLQDHGFDVRLDLDCYEAVGCGRCGGMGYKGRIGLYEVMPLGEEVRRLVLARAAVDEIAAVAVRDGMRRLRDDGLEKVRAGVTSVAEVARVTGTG